MRNTSGTSFKNPVKKTGKGHNSSQKKKHKWPTDRCKNVQHH